MADQLDDCPFCKIVAEQGYEPDGYFLLKPLNPVTDGHLMALPTNHIENAFVDPAVTAKVWELAESHGEYLKGFLGVDAFNLITSVGEAATQSVMHLHVHIVPRRPGDGLHLPWTGQEK